MYKLLLLLYCYLVLTTFQVRKHNVVHHMQDLWQYQLTTCLLLLLLSCELVSHKDVTEGSFLTHIVEFQLTVPIWGKQRSTGNIFTIFFPTAVVIWGSLIMISNADFMFIQMFFSFSQNVFFPNLDYDQHKTYWLFPASGPSHYAPLWIILRLSFSF